MKRPDAGYLFHYIDPPRPPTPAETIRDVAGSRSFWVGFILGTALTASAAIIASDHLGYEPIPRVDLHITAEPSPPTDEQR